MSTGEADKEAGSGARGGVATCKANVPGSVLIALDKKLNKMNALIARAGKREAEQQRGEEWEGEREGEGG